MLEDSTKKSLSPKNKENDNLEENHFLQEISSSERYSTGWSTIQNVGKKSINQDRPSIKPCLGGI
jgi:hypothetical protein